MNTVITPSGRTRISTSVLESVAFVAAKDVGGIIDISTMTKGAAIGAAVGGVVGSVGGGVGGAVIGIPAGSALGATVAYAYSRELKRTQFLSLDETDITLHLQVSAEYVLNLVQLAEEVRARVRRAILDFLEMEVGEIHITFTEVLPVRRQHPSRKA